MERTLNIKNYMSKIFFDCNITEYKILKMVFIKCMYNLNIPTK